MGKDLAFVLVGYNNHTDVICLADSLLSQNAQTITICDNSESTDMYNMLRERYYSERRVNLVYIGWNSGFGRAVNSAIGLLYNRGIHYACLLNPDIVIPRDFVQRLENNLGFSRRIYGAKILRSSDSSIWFNGGYIDWTGTPRHNTEINGDKKIDFITGCLMLISVADFRDLGGFDSNYFMYYEDVDFSQRALAEKFELQLIEGLEIEHAVSSSSGGEYSFFSNSMMIKNRLYYFKKNHMYFRILFYWLVRPLYLTYYFIFHYKMFKIHIKTYFSVLHSNFNGTFKFRVG